MPVSPTSCAFVRPRAGKAADAAQQAEERIARRDARRDKALAHNEASAAKSPRAGGLRPRRPGRGWSRQREAMTAGMAPEEVRAIDAARDAEIEQARAIEVARSELVARQARQLQQGWDRGLDRDGPGLGF